MAPLTAQNSEMGPSGFQDARLAFEREQATAKVASLLESRKGLVHAITQSLSLAAAISELTAKKVGNLPVLDHDGSLVGVLSERDVMTAITETGDEALEQPVCQFMTRAPKTCSSSDRLVDVMKTMNRENFRHMPVVDNGHLCGMISMRDIVEKRVRDFECEGLGGKEVMVG